MKPYFIDNKLAVFIVGKSHDTIFGLTGGERITRVAKRVGIPIIVSKKLIDAFDDVIFVNGGFAYDDRVLMDFFSTRGSVLVAENINGERIVIGASCQTPIAAEWLTHIETGTPLSEFSGNEARFFDYCQLSGFYNPTTGKRECPVAMEISSQDVNEIEHQLFSNGKQGATDFVAKLLFPAFDFFTTKRLVEMKIRPGSLAVGCVSLAATAAYLFWTGAFILGIIIAWASCFLCDIKAHLIHAGQHTANWGRFASAAATFSYPPLWYATWALGVSNSDIDARFLNATVISTSLIIILVSFAIRRGFEGYFTLRHNIEIQVWKPFDYFFRYVAGARHLNLVLLSIFALLQAPDIGLAAVAVWSAITLLVYAVRVYLAECSAAQRPLKSWMAEY